ncbi:hypothetical protein SI65_05760 [Aspergillus cristatus]|nr:hypothetical protein SI65_07446 [Aspergillus cristatus]ODM18640.1 hypothetical protein SI65_05257 [Aspergillus cristatus]ODM19143.1 hypothetical protein SI65_05760 [Aspergillus cristatus]
MDIDDQTQHTIEPANYPVPQTPSDQGGDHNQPQAQEYAHMNAKEHARLAENQPGRQLPRQNQQQFQQIHQQAFQNPHSNHQQQDDRDETIRALREEVEALRQARQPKHMPGGDNQLIEQLARLFERSDGQSAIDREEKRLHQLAKTHWRETRRLQGRENYSEWRKNLLIDADYIGARDVLLHPDRVSKDTPLQTTFFDTSKRLLHTRTLDRLTLDILHQVQTNHTQTPSEILARLDTIYGVSPAEERLLLVKTLMNLKPNGDTVSMMRQWQRITTEIEQKKYDASELCHDIGIVLLGDFQRSFVRTQLDSLFAGSKRDQFHEMDMDDIINQIESRTPPSPHTYKPLSYTIFRQDPWNPNHPTSGPTNRGTHKGGNSQPNSPGPNTSGKRLPLCSHCKRGYHSLDDCWMLHPEKRPPKPDNLNSTSRKPDGFANLVRSTANANDWVLDTGATWTIYDDQSAFVNYMPLTTTSTVGLPDGSTHKVEGIGTIHLPIGEHVVELKNVRYVPALHTRLLSFNQLEKQGFRIQLTAEKPYRFRITSPNGSAFLISRTVEDGMFDRLEAEKGVAYAVNDAKETNENKSKNLTPNRPPPAPIECWHHRLAHMNQHDLQYLHRIGRINIQGKKLLPTCDYCRQAKTTRKIGNGPTPRATQPGRRLHVDIFGGGLTLGKPSDDDAPPANDKYKYAMILTDDATRMRWLFPLQSRDNPNHTIKNHINWLAKIGYQVAYLRGDGEFFRNSQDWPGIKIEPSAPYSPWQNGVSERGIRILLERTRAVLYASGLPRRFWLDALMDTVQKANYLPTSTPLFNDPTPDGNILNEHIKKSAFYIPAEAWENRPMNIAYLRPFGAKIWYHRHGTRKPEDKMDARGASGILLGHRASNIALVWDQEKNTIIDVPDGHVDEGKVSLTNPSFTDPSMTLLTPSTNQQATPQQPYLNNTQPHLDDIMTRPAKGFAAYTVGATSRDVPKTLKLAMNRDDKAKWLHAMEREIAKLESKGIFELVRISDIPKNKRIFPGKWVYDSKEDYEPTDDRSYKARWVILGNLVEKDDMQYDYCKYAPVVFAATTRLLFALAAAYGWHLRKFDIAVAFLNGLLMDEIYMRQPTGFEKGDGLAWRLKNSIYGLTPAARIWYDTMTAVFHRLGFKTCPYDAGLFIHQTRPHLYITTHVDDFQLVAERAEDIEWTKNALANEWEVKDVSDMTHYLGMEVKSEDGCIYLNQREYIKELIKSFGLEKSHPQPTPLPTGLMVDDLPNSTIITREYQRGTGKLQWLAVKTRPDIAEAACLLARFNTAPTKKCWNALLHVIRYLKGTIDEGLIYYPRTQRTVTAQPRGFSDSNWAGPNSDRKSIGGYIFLFGGSPISWQSKRQTCVATSSNEAEYMAGSEAAKEAVWLRRLCFEMGLIGHEAPPLELYMDNEGAIALTSTEGTKRSKHIDVRFHHVRDLQALGLVSVESIRSKENPADGLTKILNAPAHRHFLHLINMDRHHHHQTGSAADEEVDEERKI